MFLFCLVCLVCLCARLFICAMWSPAGKGLTSWLSFVVCNCEFVTFPLVSWVRCGTLLYRFLIFALLLTFTDWLLFPFLSLSLVAMMPLHALYYVYFWYKVKHILVMLLIFTRLSTLAKYCIVLQYLLLFNYPKVSNIELVQS